ncbi:gamma-glutamyltransferase family protein [Pseudonocardiaceae bacterium YIM PH 21723]|nr:gamma-glutamyltransferase family protein [Pseudonocardiaceae bacterium YIM PH 21723]
MFTTRPELTGSFGMVASTHWLATATGMSILEQGGNAFDAAVAAGFTLQVAEPHLNGLGGEVPAIFTTAANPVPTVLCGQGVAPAAATPAYFRELGLDLVPGNGLLAATTPGAWDGWLMLLRDHGTFTLRQVLDQAIGYARTGVPWLPGIRTTIDAVTTHFREHWPSSARLWLEQRADAVRQPALADTYERLLAAAVGPTREAQIDAARKAWSQGFIAEAIEDFGRQAFRDESGADHAGLLTGQDLAQWQASYEDALTVDLPGGWTLAKIGAWSQGPALAQQLQLLRGFDLEYSGGRPTARTIHLAVEAAKLAFADREAWYGDHPDVPVKDLVSEQYADQRRSLIGDTASLELRPGSPGGRTPVFAEYIAQGRGIGAGEGKMGGGLGEPTVRTDGVTRGDTVHIDIVDRWGNMISATPSGGWLQSSPTIPELGFCLNSRAQMFWLDEGLPNSIGPGKRPRITLSPSLALRDGQPRIAFGTPGGDQQDQWQLVLWLAHTVGGLNLQAAIDSPAWQSAAFPSSFYPRSWEPGQLVVESRHGEEVLGELRERGHTVVDAGPWALGRLSAVSRDPETGWLRGAANPRGSQGYAAGR